MTGAECRYAQWDAAYVLHALEDAEREEYERHLDQCAQCRTNVEQLRGTAAYLEALDSQSGLALEPELPTELWATSLRRHRARWVAPTLAVAAAAVLVIVAVIGTLAWVNRAPEPTTAVSLIPAAAVKLSSNVELTEVGWGTKIRVNCSYPAGEQNLQGPTGDRYAESAAGYALVLTDLQGRESQVATWGAVPGKEIELQAATVLRPGQISRIQITAQDGGVLLSAPISVR